MAYQKLFEALQRVCGFTALESDMHEIIDAIETDKAQAEYEAGFISTEYLMHIHPEITKEQAESLLNYCKSSTITHKECYGNGEIMFARWKNADQLWYYFGSYPVQIPKGTLPRRPYQEFATQAECWEYINTRNHDIHLKYSDKRIPEVGC